MLYKKDTNQRCYGTQTIAITYARLQEYEAPHLGRDTRLCASSYRTGKYSQYIHVSQALARQ